MSNIYYRILNRLFTNKYIIKIANIVLPFYYKYTMFFAKGISNRDNIDTKIIISLTSIPSRIDKLWICIESLLRQSYKPDKIILWLDENQFYGMKLPDILLKQVKRGLEIKYCADLKSHTKYYYTLQRYPHEILVTVDDDIIYPFNFLKNLIKQHKKFPNCIVCYRAHKILFDKDKKIKKYNEWEWESPNFMGPSHLLFQTGVSGVLYPPKSLYKDVLNKDKFMTLCPKADDIWLKIMALLNGTKIVKVNPYSIHFISIKENGNKRLSNYNVINGGNDEQIKKVFKEYNIDLNSFLE